MHRDQVSNLESSRSERDVLPVPPSLCTPPPGVAVRRRHPVDVDRHGARALTWARSCVCARHEGSASVLNLGIQGVNGQGPSSTDPVIGGDSRYGTTKKGLASARPLEIGEMIGYRELSPPIRRARQNVRGCESSR